MKTTPLKIRDASRRRGNTLMVTLAVTALIGATLATYLRLTTSQNQLTIRSQVWNACMPVVEAGIEEALTHCQKNYESNMVSSGWSLFNNAYVKSNHIGDGYYLVAISQTLPYEIVSRGYYPMPGSRDFLSRTVKVQTKPQGVFFGSLIVKDSISLNGNDIRTDSYDSTNPSLSTNGRYDPSKVGDNGDVGCLSGLLNTFRVGNADIYGKVWTSPTAGIRIGPNGGVGSVGWHNAGLSGVEPGWWRNDLNMDFPDVEIPYAAAVAPSGGVVNGTNYSYVIGNGNYEVPTLGGHVMITGDATVLVRGDVKFNSNDHFIIAPGAKLKLYVAGANTQIGTVVNGDNVAPAFLYYGLPGNRNISIGGTSALTAAVYAPNASVEFNGSATVFGSVMARSAALNGASSFHYDEALGKVPPARLVVIDTWNEI